MTHCAAVTNSFAEVMVETEMTAFNVRQVRDDIPRRDIDQSVLHILGMYKQNVIQHLKFTQQGRTHKTVEVAAGNQTIFEDFSWHNKASRIELVIVFCAL